VGHRNTTAPSATWRLLLLSVIASGFAVAVSVENISAQSSSRQVTGPLRVCARNPRYFTDGSGKAIYFATAHTWTNLQDIGFTDPPPAFDFDRYLRFLTDHHYNYIRLWRWETPKGQESEVQRAPSVETNGTGDGLGR
jgi:hypothetical protein